MPDDDDGGGATSNQTTTTTRTAKKQKKVYGIGRGRNSRCKSHREGTTTVNFLNRNEVRREVPSVTLRVIVDDELVSNPDEDEACEVPPVTIRVLVDDELVSNPDEL